MGTISLAPVLEALRAVRNTMISEFPDVDVIRLYEYVDNGAAKEMARHASADYRYDPQSRDLVVKTVLDDSQVRATDEAISRAFNRRILPQMPRFSQLMEAIAPILRRYSKALEAVKSYIRKEKHQSQTMMSFGILIFITSYVLLLIKFMLVMEGAQEAKREAGTEYKWIAFSVVPEIGVWTLVFLAINVVSWTWIRMMRDRVKALNEIDLDFYERYDKKLAKNLFVCYAYAYTKGDQERFVREQMVQQMQEAEDEAEELNSVCEGANATASGRFDDGKCKLEGCDNISKTLSETFTGFIEHTWASRNDTRACGAIMLQLLEYLSSVKDGRVFDEQDRHSMWSRIHKRVNKLERLVYRSLDVDGGRTHDQMDRELEVVRDQILPLLRLTAVETKKLVPDARVTQYVDGSYMGKLDAWRTAIEDPDCVWAAFHPKRGGVFAMRNLPETHPLIEEGSIFDRVQNTRRDDDEGEKEEDVPQRRVGDRKGKVRHSKTPLVMSMGSEEEMEWTVLVKRANLCDVLNTGPARATGEGGTAAGLLDSPDNKHITSSVPDTFVCAMGIHADAENALRRLHEITDDRQNGNENNDANDEDTDDANRLEHLCNTDACGKECAVVSKPKDGDSRRWGFEPDKMMDATYEDVFADPRRSTDTVFCMRTSPAVLFTTNFEQNALVTMHITLPLMIERIVKTIRENHERIYIRDHEEYLMHELEAFYGKKLFRHVKPLVIDVFQQVMDNLESLWGAVGDTGLYISQERFDDRISSMGFARVKKLVYDTGRLSVLAHNYQRNFTTKRDSEGRSGVTGGLSGRVVQQIITDVFYATLISLMMGITNRVKCYKQERCDGTSLAKSLMIMFSSMIFFFTLIGTNVKRQGAQDRFNRLIKERNSKTFVTACARTMEGFAQQLEHLAGRRVAGAERIFNVTRLELADLYKSINYMQGLQRLFPDAESEEDDDNNNDGDASPDALEDETTRDTKNYERQLVETKPVDTKGLYRHVRQVIEKFNSCHTLDSHGTKAPFPVYEIVNYTLVAVGALAICGLAIYKLKPMLHIKYIRELNDLKSDLDAGSPPPKDFEAILGCSKAAGDIWPILSTVLIGLLLIATIMLAVYMMRTTNLYEMGLYASGLFSKGRCTK